MEENKGEKVLKWRTNKNNGNQQALGLAERRWHAEGNGSVGQTQRFVNVVRRTETYAVSVHNMKAYEGAEL
jgi:hypothetical protein